MDKIFLIKRIINHNYATTLWAKVGENMHLGKVKMCGSN